MEILASCSVEESLQYKGKLQIESEDGKVDKVVLNIVVDNGDTSILKNLNSNIKCVTFKNISKEDLKDVDIPEGRVFNEVEYESHMLVPRIDNVTTLIRLPDRYSDMREAKSLCSRGENTRVIGGNLLNIEGVKIGRYDSGKDKGSPVYNGIYDQFLEVDLKDLGNISEKVKKARKKLSSPEGSKKSTSSKKVKVVAKKNNISKSFTTLFGSEEEDF
jgi:hypothetical protein